MAITTNSDDMVVVLRDAMERSLKENLDAKFEELKKGWIEKIDKEKDQILAGIALNVMRMVKFDTFQDNIVLTVKTEPLKP